MNYYYKMTQGLDNAWCLQALTGSSLEDQPDDLHACWDIHHSRSHLSRNPTWRTEHGVKREPVVVVEVVAGMMATVEMMRAHVGVKPQRWAEAAVQADNWRTQRYQLDQCMSCFQLPKTEPHLPSQARHQHLPIHAYAFQ